MKKKKNWVIVSPEDNSIGGHDLPLGIPCGVLAVIILCQGLIALRWAILSGTWNVHTQPSILCFIESSFHNQNICTFPFLGTSLSVPAVSSSLPWAWNLGLCPLVLGHDPWGLGTRTNAGRYDVSLLALVPSLSIGLALSTWSEFKFCLWNLDPVSYMESGITVVLTPQGFEKTVEFICTKSSE